MADEALAEQAKRLPAQFVFPIENLWTWFDPAQEALTNLDQTGHRCFQE